MMLAAAFLVFFVGGPLIFRGVTQGTPTATQLRIIAAVTIALSLGSLAVRYGFAPQWGDNLILTIAGILLIWLAWIGILAFATQALRRVDRGPRMRRWTAVIGSVGTTAPWFGLAFASYAST